MTDANPKHCIPKQGLCTICTKCTTNSLRKPKKNPPTCVWGPLKPGGSNAKHIDAQRASDTSKGDALWASAPANEATRKPRSTER